MRTLLAIESSCDETAAAVLRGHREVLSHVVFSQADIHSQFGGVVPEVASRNHLLSAPVVIEQALEAAKLKVDELDMVAATNGPGLAAALLVGAAFAKGLAIGAGKPFLAVDHLEGHMLSPFFGRKIIPPHISLVVSGGHTLLVDVRGVGNYRLLGRTLDDAAGEAFDKVAKLLGLGYPGGAKIDQMAAGGIADRFDFPRGMLDSGDYDFSFSGLKTAVRVFLERHGCAEQDLPDICASFQAAVVDVLITKLFRAVKSSGYRTAAISGGVAANSCLQARVAQKAEKEGIELLTPSFGLHTDNALMIAYAASHHAASGQSSPIDLDIRPNFDLHRLQGS
jgi:N6-L-threonylcarbamoyladenine synthase